MPAKLCSFSICNLLRLSIGATVGWQWIAKMAANTTKDLLKSDKLAHKVNLAETVKKLNKGKICNFAFGSQVDHFDFKMFQVEDLGYIKVPVSLAVINF